MSLLPPEQFAAIQKASLDALFGLTRTAFEGCQKLVELNLQATRSALAGSQDHVLKALSVREPQDLAALAALLMQPTTGKIQSYGRQVFAIITATQTEMAKLAGAQVETHQRQVQTLVDTVAQRAPAGSEAAVTALKSAITATSTLYETVQRTTQQAVDVAESNFSLASAAASKATQQAVERASRAAKK
ncbi:phasin family protein [Paraburkholderia sediminicola]|uniref:phasin family protein n=1 Tax=Paraburkholderia sediminicola TaxID=458836 RepID=UPI0038B99397